MLKSRNPGMSYHLATFVQLPHRDQNAMGIVAPTELYSRGVLMRRPVITAYPTRNCVLLTLEDVNHCYWGISLVPSRKKIGGKIRLVTLRTILDTRSNFHTSRQEFERANRNAAFFNH